jgi:predicted amidohydrolase
MEILKIASAQFEHRSNDKGHNLSVIKKLSLEAAQKGADIISFHECSVTGYSFARHLTREELLSVSELIPGGDSLQELVSIAKLANIILLAGLFEKDQKGNIYKAYVCVDKDGLIKSYRKLHPFINPHIRPGSEYCVFELKGWKCGILVCYDNNIIENVRANALLGAEIIFMPHVTMCTPTHTHGRIFIYPKLWKNSHTDPFPLRLEFDGPK